MNAPGCPLFGCQGIELDYLAPQSDGDVASFQCASCGEIYDPVMLPPVTTNPSTPRALQAIAAERNAQDVKWGAQSHPMLPPYLLDEAHIWADTTRRDADVARDMCQSDTPKGADNWLHILHEEYQELVAAMWSQDIVDIRGELVQVAAVCARMLEAINEQGLGES